MRIGGWKKCSLIDFPGRIATIIFTQGCCFSCPFCHNKHLWSTNESSQFNDDEVINFLIERGGKIEGLVVSGGEPTMQPDLIPFLRRVRKIGVAIKLDTNGVHPDVVDDILKKGLVDYIAMDVKHLLGKRYEVACGRPVDQGAIEKTMAILRENRVDYEFRTTVVPTIHTVDEVKAMVPELAGAPLFVLQNFVPDHAANPRLRLEKPFLPEEMEEMRRAFEGAVARVLVR